MVSAPVVVGPAGVGPAGRKPTAGLPAPRRGVVVPAQPAPFVQPGSASAISDREFARISEFIYKSAGISLSANKKTLVAGRLFRRLEVVGAGTYGEYLDHVENGPADGEMQTAIDLLTTNETYFWREARHFELAERLAREAAAARRPFSIWSAACSTGEEVYTLAMVLENIRAGGTPLDWNITGSDISVRVLRSAQRGLYPMDRATQLPQALLKKFCRKGTGPQAGYLLVDRALREKVRFAQINLVESLPDTPTYDMIFLRNVMIYFDAPTKTAAVTRLLTRLKPGGTFCVGLAETLNGIVTGLKGNGPGAYLKAAP